MYFNVLSRQIFITVNFLSFIKSTLCNMMKDEILIIKQVAAYLKINERTLYFLATSREIPAFKVGNSWRFKQVYLESWIAVQLKAAKAGLEEWCPLFYLLR